MTHQEVQIATIYHLCINDLLKEKDKRFYEGFYHKYLYWKEFPETMWPLVSSLIHNQRVLLANNPPDYKVLVKSLQEQKERYQKQLITGPFSCRNETEWTDIKPTTAPKRTDLSIKVSKQKEQFIAEVFDKTGERIAYSLRDDRDDALSTANALMNEFYIL